MKKKSSFKASPAAKAATKVKQGVRKSPADTKAALVRYTPVAMGFHWLVALMMLCLLGVGFVMADMEPTPQKFALYGLHKSFGLLVLLLAAARLAWRFYHPAPALPAGTPRWQKMLAGATHIGLYAVMFGIPLSGWVMSDMAGFHPLLFGFDIVPHLTLPDAARAHLVAEFHETGAWLLVALLALHLAATGHHWAKNDGLAERMLPAWLKLPKAPFTLGVGLAALLLPATATAQVWNVNPVSSRIEWQVLFNKKPIKGNFKNWNGEIFVDPKILEATRIRITVYTSSISSGDFGRDKTLQTDQWLDSRRYPTAVFTSSKMVPAGSNIYVVDGSFTLAGITKPLSFPVKLDITGDQLKATGGFPLSRLSYEVGAGDWQRTSDISDNVSVTFVVNAVRNKK